MRRRTAHERAAFALPFLSEANRIVDVGCGPGTITIGLAQATASDTEILGVDRKLSQVEMAREAAQAAGVTNAQFKQSSAYELPLADHSVDLVFAHAVFKRLAFPERALTEFSRVLRGNGVIAVTNSDWSGAHLEPWDDDVDRALRGHYLLRSQAGGDPFISDAGDDDQGELRQAAEAARRWATQRGTFTQSWVEVTARLPIRDCSIGDYGSHPSSRVAGDTAIDLRTGGMIR